MSSELQEPIYPQAKFVHMRQDASWLFAFLDGDSKQLRMFSEKAVFLWLLLLSSELQELIYPQAKFVHMRQD